MSRTSLHFGENPFACMCATTLRTPSVVPRSQHVLRSYCWQNVKPRFFEGGLPCDRKSGYPACDTHVGALDLAATPERNTARSAAASDRARIARRSVMLPRAVMRSRSAAMTERGATVMRNTARNATRLRGIEASLPHASIAIPRFRHRRIKNARWRECRAKYVTGNVSGVVSPRHSRRRTRRGHEARRARRTSRASRV